MFRRRHKYNAQATGGFPSKREARQFLDLRMLEAAGLITELKRQVSFSFDIAGVHICRYVVDFTYFENGKLVAHETKGFKTPEYKIKKKLFQALFPEIEHRET